MNKAKKSLKSLLALVCAAALLLGTLSTLAACGGKTSISFEKNELSMGVGDAVKIEYTVSPEDAEIDWETSNKKVASVTKRGVVNAVSKGTAVISATLSNGAKAECQVTVYDRTVTISQTTAEVDLSVSNTLTLTASASDGGTITWQTSDSSVATVNNGVVKFEKAIAQRATVTITAQCGVAKASCEITVVDPRIPEDYYLLSKETNANVVANPGRWYYHADGAESTNYRFTEDGKPAFGGGKLTAELDKFPSLDNASDKKYFRFRYQPTLPEGTKYTMKFTVKMNVDCTMGFGSVSTAGGVNTQSVKAGVAKQILFIGTVNNKEPFHLNINALPVPTDEAGTINFEISGITVKEYEEGDEDDITIDIPDTPLPDEYELTRGTTGETCTNAGKWYYMIDPENAGASDFSQANYDHGTVTLALNGSLSGQYHQLRIQPRYQLNTRVEATFTVSLSAPSKITFGRNGNSGARTAAVFGTELTPEDEANGVQLYNVGEEVTLKKVFAVTNNDPFVIAVVPDNINNPCTMVVKDATFAEKALETFTVTYETNGGNEIPAESVVEEKSIAQLPTPVKDGKVFVGWYDNSELTGTKYVRSYTPTASVTLYAKWADASEVFTVTYNAKDGSANTVENVIKTESVTLPVISREGNEFGGWYTDEACTAGNKIEGSTYTPTANVTLYAKWEKEHTVTFDTQTNGISEAAKKIADGNEITLNNNLTRMGYTFGGWFDNAACDGTAIGDTYTPTSDKTLYAKWTALTEYDLVKGDYGMVNKNRDAWYYNLQGNQSNGNITNAKFDNGAINLAVTGAKAGAPATNNAIQLRYLPDLPTGEQYTVTLTVTVNVAGKIKASLDNSGQSQDIAADTPTTLTFKTTVEWNDKDKLNRPFLVQFYPAVDGDVTLTVNDISVATRNHNDYELGEALNSAIKTNPGVWYHYSGQNQESAAHEFASTPKYKDGTITYSFASMSDYAYQLRYQPCASTANKTFTVSFKVAMETTEELDLETILSTSGKDLVKTANGDGSYNVTCTFTYKANDNPFYIQFKPGKAVSATTTFTVSEIAFVEAA